MSETDIYTRSWIIDQAIKVCSRYEHGVLTIRAMHYQMVGLGMPNTNSHYARVKGAMSAARRDGRIAYAQFSDHEREAMGSTQYKIVDLDDEIRHGKGQVRAWMNNFSRNAWERQPHYVEVWIEKKTLQGVFGSVCRSNRVALCPCKGYPSLTFLHEASTRFKEAEDLGKEITIIYFGDRDPSGADIPRSIKDNLLSDFDVDVEVDIRGLTERQCIDLRLPAAPLKKGDSRTYNFDGSGQIELDAVAPEMLQDWTQQALDDYMDLDIREEVDEQEARDSEIYVAELKEYVNSL